MRRTAKPGARLARLRATLHEQPHFLRLLILDASFGNQTALKQLYCLAYLGLI